MKTAFRIDLRHICSDFINRLFRSRIVMFLGKTEVIKMLQRFHIEPQSKKAKKGLFVFPAVKIEHPGASIHIGNFKHGKIKVSIISNRNRNSSNLKDVLVS